MANIYNARLTGKVDINVYFRDMESKLLTLTNNDFEENSLVITASTNSGNGFCIGSSCMKELTLTLTREGMTKLQSNNLLRRKLCLDVNVWYLDESDNELEERLGFFYVNKLDVYDYYAKLLCYDAMTFFSEKVPESVMKTMQSEHTLGDLLKLCVSNVGNLGYVSNLAADVDSIKVNSTEKFKLASDASINTYRDCIEFIAGLAGGFAYIWGYNVLGIGYYGKEESLSIKGEPDEILDVNFDPYKSKVVKITTSVGGFDYEYGSLSSGSEFDELTLSIYENPFLRGYITEGEETENANVRRVFDAFASSIHGIEFYGGSVTLPTKINPELGKIVHTRRGIASIGSNVGVDEYINQDIMVTGYTWSFQNTLVLSADSSVTNVNPSSVGINKGNIYKPFQRGGGTTPGGEDSRLDDIANNVTETRFARRESTFKDADFNVRRLTRAGSLPNIDEASDLVIYSEPIDLSGISVESGDTFYVNVFSCIYGFQIWASWMIYQLVNRRPIRNRKYTISEAAYFDPKIIAFLGVATLDSENNLIGTSEIVYRATSGTHIYIDVGQKYGDMNKFSDADIERMRGRQNYEIQNARLSSVPLRYNPEYTYRFYLGARVYQVLLSLEFTTDADTPGSGHITNVEQIDLENDYYTWGGDSGIFELGGKSYNKTSSLSFDVTYTLGLEAEYDRYPRSVFSTANGDTVKIISDALNNKSGDSAFRYVDFLYKIIKSSKEDTDNMLSLLDGYGLDTPLRNFVSSFGGDVDLTEVKQDIAKLKGDVTKINEDMTALTERVKKLEDNQGGGGGDTPTGSSSTPIARYTNESEVVIDSSHSDVLSMQLEVEKDTNTMLSFSATGGMSSEGLLDFHVFYDNSEIAFNPKFFVSKPYETISFSTSFLPISKDKRVTLSITCTTSDASINFLKDSISVSVINAELPKSDTEFYYAIEDFVVPVFAVQLHEVNDSVTTQ